MTHSAAATLTFSALSGFDWLLILIVVFSAVSAFRRGMIKVLFSLAGLVAGILLASWNYLRLAEALHGWITSFAMAEAVGFLMILTGVVLVFSVAASLVRRTAKAVGLGFFDRLLGGLLGVVRGVAVGVAVMMAVSAFVPNSAWIRASRLAPYFLTGAHAVSFVVPGGLKEQMESGTALLLQQRRPLLRPHRAPTQP